MASLMPLWMKMTLRLPSQVHKALATEAEDSGKSLNQVIVDRLNASLGGVYVSEAEANDARVIQRIEALEARMADIEKQIQPEETRPEGAFETIKESLRGQAKPKQ